MLINKFDFESALQSDKQQSGQPLQSSNSIASNKPNLFGPPGNFSGIQQPNSFSVSNSEAQAKSKRDQLWEQKRKQKQDLINPPIMRDNQAQDGAFVNMMAPKYVPQSLSKETQFQKATSFDQPKLLIEIQQPALNIQQSKPMQTPQQIVPNMMPQINQAQDIDTFYQPQNQYKSNQAQIQQVQPPRVEEYYQQPQSQQSFQNYSQNQPITPPPQINYDQDYFQPQTYQKEPQLQAYQPASQPSHIQQQPDLKQQQRIAQQQNQQIQQQQHLQKQQDQKQKQQEYMQALQQDMREKEEKKKREKEERIMKEQEELKKNLQYNPFGKGGSGAPIKDSSGNVIINRKTNNDQQNYNNNNNMGQGGRIQQKPPTPLGMGGYQQAFLPQQNSVQPQNVFYNQQQQLQGGGGFQQPQQQQFQMQNQNPYQAPQMMPQEYMNYNNLPLQQQQLPINNFGGIQQQQMPPQNMMMQPQFQQQQFNDFDFQGPPPIQQKIVAPSPQMIPSQKQQDTFQQDQSGLRIGVFNENEPIRQKGQKQELGNVLKQQMEEQKRRKDEEIRKKKEEEMREEEKIMKERQQIEREYKQEEEKKKQKLSAVQQANAQLMQAKENKNKKIIDMPDQGFQNFVVEKKSKPDIFGNNNNNNENITTRAGNLDFDNQSFDQGDAPPQPKGVLKRQTTYEGGTPNPQISQTRIINDITKELKSNFSEEIGKLREDMNSQQRQFREQLERLKIDQVVTVQQKQDKAMMSELEKIKLEIQAQRDKERTEQQRLMYALDKHNPNKAVDPIEVLQNYDKPGGFPSQSQNSYANAPPTFTLNNGGGMPTNNSNMNGSFYNSKRGVGSRQDSREGQRKKEINNYEKMFFGGTPKTQQQFQQKSQSQQREERPPSYNLKEEKLVRFNQDYFAPSPQMDYGQNQYDTQNYQPKIIKRDDSNINNMTMKSMLNGESTLLPINYQDIQQQQDQDLMMMGGGHKSQKGYDQNKENSSQNQYQQYSKPTQSQQPTQQLVGNSYLDHIKGIGAGMGNAANIYLGTDSSENTMDFVNKIVNGKDESAEKFINKGETRLADKIDDFNFNFPSIPQYDGIQNDYIKNQPPPQNQNLYQNNGVQRQNSFIKSNITNNHMGGGGYSGDRLGEGTMNSMGTLNSLNLENLNSKYDDRLAKYGINLDQTHNGGGGEQNYMPKLQSNSGLNQGPVDTNDELKKLDNLLFDLLRDGGGLSNKEQKPQSQGYDPSPNQRSQMQQYGQQQQYGNNNNKIVHINSHNNAENIAKMRGTREQFMAPQMGLINEDGGEDFDATYKVNKGGYGGGGNHFDNNAYKLPNDIRRYDSLLDSTNLALD